MIPTTEIRDAVNRRLLQLWPKRTVYVDVCPVDFARPSCWLQLTRDDRIRANRFFVKRTVAFKITLYDAQDDHYETSWSRLAEDADRLLCHLSTPLYVGSRSLLMVCKALPREPDRAAITFTVDFMDKVPLGVPEAAPLMEVMETSVEMRK